MNKPRKARIPNKQRRIEDIKASGIARLAREASRLVPCSYARLFKLQQAGHLEVFGDPMCVDIDHLMDQFANGFPVVGQDKSGV